MPETKSRDTPGTKRKHLLYTTIFIVCVAFTLALVLLAPNEAGTTAFLLLGR